MLKFNFSSGFLALGLCAGLVTASVSGCSGTNAPELTLSSTPNGAMAPWHVPQCAPGLSGSLRSAALPIDASRTLYVSGADVVGNDTTLWSTRAKLDVDKWALETPKEITSDGYLFAFYPDKGFKRDQNDNIFYSWHPGEAPLLYAREEYGKDKPSLTLTLKNLMVKFTVRLDFSDYKGAKKIEEIALADAPWRANINVKTGNVYYVDSYDYVSQNISTTVTGEVYDFEFYSFPMPKGKSPSIRLTLDGNTFSIDLRSASDIEWKSGENYTYTAKVQSMNDRTPIALTEDVRSDDTMEVYDVTEAPYFRLSATSGQWRILPKDQTTVIGIFVENMTDQDFNGDVRLVLEDLSHHIVQQGTYWSHFPIKSYQFDGLRLPFIARVPAGEYYLQVYLRREGDTKWFKPDMIGDIASPEDRKVTVTEHYPYVRFATAEWRTRDQNGGPFYESLISTVRLNTPYRYAATINSYEAENKPATIRLYHCRDTKSDGYSLFKDKGKSAASEWKDLLAEKRITIKGTGQTSVSLDYKFSTKRPVVERFCGYVYATIQYDGGKEYPLQVDANGLYATSQRVSVVNDPNGGGLWNYIAAFNLSTIHYVTMAE